MFGLESGSSTIPKVGIFWFIQEPGRVSDASCFRSAHRRRRAIRRAHQLSRANTYATGARLGSASIPLFHDCEWQGLARGAASFTNTETQRFDVCLNEQLQTPEFQSEILSCFNLPKSETSFASNPHYADTRFELNLLAQHPWGAAWFERRRRALQSMLSTKEGLIGYAFQLIFWYFLGRPAKRIARGSSGSSMPDPGGRTLWRYADLSPWPLRGLGGMAEDSAKGPVHAGLPHRNG